MRLHAARGDSIAALRIYHTCSTILERELGIEPSHATREVYDRLMHIGEKGNSISVLNTNRLVETPLVGRTREWAQLQTAWRQVPMKGTSLVLITGEAGIGKTRLAEELAAWTSRQGAAIASTRCYAAEGELAYAPVTAWLRSDSLHVALSRLEDIWLTELARLLPEVLVERPDLAQPGPLLEGWQRQRLFEALARAIIGTHQPLLLLLDDMHWCDQETLEWLHYLFRFDTQSPLLLIGTVRSEEIDVGHPLRTLLTALRRNEQVTEISLEALDASDTTTLAAQMSGWQLNSHVAATLYKETEGNPLFIVETVRAGLIARYTDNGSLSRFSPTLPTTVQAVIDARLEQLTPLAQKVVRLASIIGRSFTFAVLSLISNEDEDTLTHALDELWQRRIIREQGTGASDAYDFSHDKLREVSYASLSNTRRRHLHRKVAEALEQIYGNALDRISGQIATHFEHAEMPDRASYYYELAGEAAMQVYAQTEALALFQRAIMLLDLASQSEVNTARQVSTARLYERIGDIHALSGQPDQARNAFERALSEVPTSEKILRANLYCKIGNTWEAQRNNESALHNYSKAESLLGQEPNEVNARWWQQWIEIQRNRLQVYYWLDLVSEMMKLIEKLQPIVKEYGNADQQATFFQSICLMTIRKQHYIVSDEALGYAQEALTAAQKAGM
jgi:predicted ATPase